MRKLKVLDLFSGIGGFSLGLERTGGFETVAFCEIEPFCQRVLKKHWPDVPIFEDIRKLHAKDITESIDLICGGYPCQPFSLAGQRRGEEDDRHLWPEYLRLIQDIHPRWIIAENVAGHISVGLDEVLSDLENEGYARWPFIIPACAVGADHRRDRVWIVANSRSKRKSSIPANDKNKSARPERGAEPRRGGKTATNTYSEGLEKRKRQDTGGARENGRAIAGGVARWPAEPSVGRVADGIPNALDGALRRFRYEHLNDKEAFTALVSSRKRILLSMWEQEKSTKAPHKADRKRFSHCLPEVSHRDSHERWNLGERIKEDEELRNMWKRICSKPFQETQDMQQELLVKIGEIERTKKVAPRVDRIKALGNAVVPQIPEIIGYAILETLQTKEIS